MGRQRYGVQGEVKDTADSFYRALSGKNMKLVDTSWAHVPYAAVAGRSGEIRQGWDQVRRYWEHRFEQSVGRKVTVRLVNAVCHAVGDVAWLSGTEVRTVADDEQSHRQVLRVTMVLERTGMEWRIVSYHASVPEGEAMPLAHVS